MNSIQYISPEVIKTLKNKAKKRSRHSEGLISHMNALDLEAKAHGFHHWRHICSIQNTEKAILNGVILRFIDPLNLTSLEWLEEKGFAESPHAHCLERYLYHKFEKVGGFTLHDSYESLYVSDTHRLFFSDNSDQFSSLSGIFDLVQTMPGVVKPDHFVFKGEYADYDSAAGDDDIHFDFDFYSGMND